MENQKIINLLDKIDTDSKHFATKKWYINNDENNANYGVNKDTGADNPDTIKYDTRVLKPNLCDYAETYILIDGTIRAAAANANTRLALKNCAPFTKCNLEVNDEHIDTAENLDITMPMYNLIEYSDNYQDSSGALYQYKRDEPPEANAINDLTTDTSSSFKYKVSLLGNPVVANNIPRINVKVVVPLKYLSNFFRSLEMPLINCKIKLNLTWKKDNMITCVLSTDDGNAVFIINDTKMYVPVVTLSKEDNKDFIEQKNKGFQRSVYWNEYKTKEKKLKEEDYTTGSLLDINYFDKHYKLVAVDLSKQKELDSDPRAIQQIEFKYMLGTDSTIYWVLEKSKETILEFYKGTVKVY